MRTNFVARDSFGMDAKRGTGSGPALMGANTPLGDDVCQPGGQDRGDELFAVRWAAMKADTVNKRGKAWAPS